MPKKSARKIRRVRHLNEVPAKVHLKSGKLKIIVEVPWSTSRGDFARSFRQKDSDVSVENNCSESPH